MRTSVALPGSARRPVSPDRRRRPDVLAGDRREAGSAGQVSEAAAETVRAVWRRMRVEGDKSWASGRRSAMESGCVAWSGWTATSCCAGCHARAWTGRCSRE
ncbi:protein of unknown function [Burkholderia multivorans]